MGKGSVLHADVGHLYAFGNTEERYRIKILGCKGKGTLGVDRPFNHATKVLGRCVKERTGDYDDALRNKKALVIPMILEAFGGISPHSLHFIRRLARRTEGRARATAHRLQSFEHERQVVLRTPHAAARSGRAGGRREGDPEEDHRDEDAPYQRTRLRRPGGAKRFAAGPVADRVRLL